MLTRMKKAIDSEPPKQPEFMKDNKKRKVLRQLYNHKVYYENTLLLKKLSQISQQRGALNKDRLLEANFAHRKRDKNACFKINERNTLHNAWHKSQKEDKVRSENDVCSRLLTGPAAQTPQREVLLSHRETDTRLHKEQVHGRPDQPKREYPARVTQED